MNSKIFGLNWTDFKKSIQMVIISSAIPALVVILNEGRLPNLADAKSIGFITLGAWLSYLVKNFLTNSKGEFLEDEPQQ